MFKKTIAVIAACALSSCSLVSSCLYRPVKASAASATVDSLADAFFKTVLSGSGVATTAGLGIYMQLSYLQAREAYNSIFPSGHDMANCQSQTGYYWLNGKQGVLTGFCFNTPSVVSVPKEVKTSSFRAFISMDGSATLNFSCSDFKFYSSSTSTSSNLMFNTSFSGNGNIVKGDYWYTATGYWEPLNNISGTSHGANTVVNFTKIENQIVTWNNPNSMPQPIASTSKYSLGLPDSEYKMPSMAITSYSDFDIYETTILIPYIVETFPDAPILLDSGVPPTEPPTYSPPYFEELPFQALPSLPSPESFPEIVMDGTGFWFTKFDELVEGFGGRGVLVTVLVIASLVMLLVGV